MNKSLFLTIETDSCAGSETEVNYLEHVQAVITLNATRRGSVQLFLRSPMGTRSMILSERINDDDSQDGFTKWPFMTTHTWAENPRGKWTGSRVCQGRETGRVYQGMDSVTSWNT